MLKRQDLEYALWTWERQGDLEKACSLSTEARCYFYLALSVSFGKKKKKAVNTEKETEN